MATKRHPASTLLDILARGGEVSIGGQVFVMQDDKLWYKAERFKMGSGQPPEQVLLDPDMPFNTFVCLAKEVPEEKLWEAGANLVLTELNRKDRKDRFCPVCDGPLTPGKTFCPATGEKGVQSVVLRGCGKEHDSVSCKRCGVNWPESSCSFWRKHP